LRTLTRTLPGIAAYALLWSVAYAQDGGQQTAAPSVPIDIPAEPYPTGQTRDIAANGTLILRINVPTLRRAVLAPRDVVDASLEISLANSSPLGSIAVYRLVHPSSKSALTRADFASEPIAILPVEKSLPSSSLSPGTRVVEIRGLGDDLRKALNESPEGLPILLIARTKTSSDKLISSIRNTVVKVTIISHPKVALFTAQVQQREGVYAQNRDGHLYYGDQRLRLWGCVRPQLPNIETVDRIASMGFNAIRMWGPRANDSATGTSALIDDGSGKFVSSTPGDGSPLDEYDRFYAEAKKAGLFVMATGLTGFPHLSSRSEWLKGDGQNWGDWQKAMSSKPDDWIVNFMAAVDDRLYRARQQQVRNYLTHVNPYTGKDYAHDEAIAVYELANENAHVKRTLERGFDKWPPFFVSELQRSWNQWLTLKYRDDVGLIHAWTKLDASESLDARSIKLEPVVIHRDSYSTRRGSDFIRFLIELDGDLNKKMESYARTFAPRGVGVAVIPFSYDTQYMPSNAWLFDDTNHADVANFGMYFWSLQNPLTKPPGMYVMDSSTVERKITVIYETMDGRPDPYRAAYPYRLAALASWEDWDAIFFHYWDGFHEKGRTYSDEDYLTGTLSYIAPTHYWTAVYYEKDPALLSPMAIAGQMFIQGAIAPAPHPLTYVLGARSIFDLGALGGADLARATYSQGARIRFEPNSDSGTTVEGKVYESLDAPPTEAISMGDQVLWDWPNGRLIIDTPTAKAYVGVPHGKYRFADGTVVGGFDDHFVSFGMISSDGAPLMGAKGTRRIYISAANDARNTGYHIRFNEAVDPMPSGGPLGIGKLIKENGTSPVQVDRVPYQVWFPTNLNGHFDGYDLARRQRLSKMVLNGHLEHDGTELYLGSLFIDKPGTHTIATPQPDFITPAATPPTTHPGVISGGITDTRLANLWNPLPGIKWSDGLPGVEDHLRSSGVHFDAATAVPGHLHLANTDAFFHTASDADVIGQDDHISSISVVFSQPPLLTDVIAAYDKQLGPAAEKQIAATEDQITTVKWSQKEGGAALTVTLTETQGTLGIVYTATF
jgi:hypothetical protein